MSGSERYIGLMSGTSLDGVDAALVDFSSGRPNYIATAYVPYPPDLRAELLALHQSGMDELRRAAMAANHLTKLYADAAGKVLAEANSSGAHAIGCHGQTIRHAPDERYTLQLNNPALLAELTGISVVADFRNRDIAAGGQGAPLVPAFHDAVFRHPTADRVILNIGGIANITHLVRNAPATGFDCGPGNMLLDAWVQQHLARNYDENGNWAAQGKVLLDLLERLIEHPFLTTLPPKSCGREQFSLEWLRQFLNGDENPADVQATLVEFTATSIANAITRWCGQPDELFLCGGGAHNGYLVSVLHRCLPGVRIAKTDILGMPADWVEAVAFAWLARQALLGLPGNLPEVTGAKGLRILGGIYPA